MKRHANLMVALITAVSALCGCSEELSTREKHYPNGQLQKRWTERLDSAGNFVKHGKIEAWWEAGGKAAEGTFDNGKYSGTWSFWDENGKKHTEFEFVGGVWRRAVRVEDDGTTVFDFEKGAIIRIEGNGLKRTETEWQFPSDMEVGSRVDSSPEEELDEWGFAWMDYQELTSKGHKQGIYREWHDNGEKREEGTYVDGRKTGTWTSWHENGEKREEGKYVDGKKTGTWITWYEKGQKRGEYEYGDGGETGRSTSWHENGQMESRGTFDSKEYTLDEAVESAHADHEVRSLLAVCYRKGYWLDPLERFEKRFSNDRELARTCRKLGLSHQDLRSYLRIVSVRMLKGGRFHGRWVYWHDNGKKSAEGDFLHGTKHGRWISWDEYGNIVSETFYEQGIEVKEPGN